MPLGDGTGAAGRLLESLRVAAVPGLHDEVLGGVPGPRRARLASGLRLSQLLHPARLCPEAGPESALHRRVLQEGAGGPETGAALARRATAARPEPGRCRGRAGWRR